MAVYLGTNKVGIYGPVSDGGFTIGGRLLAVKTYSFKLSETNFSSLTPSTTAQTLTLPATSYSSAGTTMTCFQLGPTADGTPIDVYKNDYFVFFEGTVEFSYASSVSGTIHGIRTAYTRDFQYYHYYSGVNSSTGKVNDSYNATSTYTTSSSRLLYQKADNTYGISTTAYGIYMAPTPVAVTASTSLMKLQIGSVSVRGSDSYCPVAAINALSAANTTLTGTWYIYEGNRNAAGELTNRAVELATNS